jgi:crossover junction endodeoxyribonuclease RuvC
MAAVIALGIDPGIAACGFGVVEFVDGRLRLLDAGSIRSHVSASDGDRLEHLHRALAGLIARHRPDRVGVERLYFQRNVRTAMAVSQARGVALLAAAQARLAVDEPTPNEVKLAVCGNGAADKHQVAAMVERLLGVTLPRAADDATDAVAVAIGCAYRAAVVMRAASG